AGVRRGARRAGRGVAASRASLGRRSGGARRKRAGRARRAVGRAARRGAATGEGGAAARVMRGLWPLLRYLRPHGRDVSLVLGATAVGIALDVLRPWPLKILVDQVLEHEAVPAPLAALVGPAPDPWWLLGAVSLATVGIFLAGTLTEMVSTV